ncbi:Zinc finger CCCH domain-containing protein 5 isoform B [Glycine soja]|uniref:Zinc finger CCCH domain-containing protein 5 isoform B n=1 Tax=Glycine soja TaxID=3848 RepID=A0A445JFF1_GLYSO|nr:Zinc finger CCCH domain-containing protein 5 isoform B [Glycine soja]
MEEKDFIEEGKSMSRKEKRKAMKKMKRKQARKEEAERERREEEERLNNPEEQRRMQLLEQQEAERMQRDMILFREREKAWMDTVITQKQQQQQQQQQEDEDDEYEYVEEEGPPEIIWQGNEIIFKKKQLRVRVTDRDKPKPNETNQNDHQVNVYVHVWFAVGNAAVIPKHALESNLTSNPLPPESIMYYMHSSDCMCQPFIIDYHHLQQEEDNKPTSNPLPPESLTLENVAQQIPNFGTEQDKAHCPFHLKTGACRFGIRCSRVHFYPDKSSTLLIKNMYSGPGLACDQDQDEGLEVCSFASFLGNNLLILIPSPLYTDEEVERCFEEFYEDVHTEFLKFGEIVNFKVKLRQFAGGARASVIRCKSPSVLGLQSLNLSNLKAVILPVSNHTVHRVSWGCVQLGLVQTDWIDYRISHSVPLPGIDNCDLKVCKNGSFHLRGNVYVQYKSLDSALLAYNTVNGRYFAGKQVSCQFVNLTRWKVAICGEYMKSGFKTCSHGTTCNFIHCFRNPGGDYEWADSDKPPPKFWVKKMIALFGYSDDYETSMEQGNMSLSKTDSDRTCHSRRRSRSREMDQLNCGHSGRRKQRDERKHRTPNEDWNGSFKRKSRGRTPDSGAVSDREWLEKEENRETHHEYTMNSRRHEEDSDVEWVTRDNEKQHGREGRNSRKQNRDEKRHHISKSNYQGGRDASESEKDFLGRGEMETQHDYYSRKSSRYRRSGLDDDDYKYHENENDKVDGGWSRKDSYKREEHHHKKKRSKH